MIESTGVAELALELTLGKPTKMSDLVSIFDSEPGMTIASVRDQSLFYENGIEASGKAFQLGAKSSALLSG